MYHEYAAHAARQYKQKDASSKEPDQTAAGDFTPQLDTLISKFSEEERCKVLEEIDQHAQYLSSMTQTSTSRMKNVIRNLSQNKSEDSPGPGLFLFKWQTLMDETPITPSSPTGPVRHGIDQSVVDATRVDTDGAKKGTVDVQEKAEGSNIKPPDVSNCVRLLVPGFRDLLRHLDAK
ncbi:hypothetical protein P7C71_g4218, partial [Lecanoromycetidae sp. Uapishka_2]